MSEAAVRAARDIGAGLHHSVKQIAKCVLIVGSHGEGLGTALSDIDAMVVVGSASEAAQLGLEECRRLDDGRRVDLAIQTSDQFVALLKEGASANLHRASTRQIELIHKATRGIVIQGTDYWNKALSEHFNRVEFEQSCISRYLWVAANEFDNVVGELGANRVPSAADFCRSMLRSTLDGYLALRGDTYAKPKWRLQRALNLVEPRLLIARYLELEFHVPYQDQALIEAWFENAMTWMHAVQSLIFASTAAPATSRRRLPAGYSVNNWFTCFRRGTTCFVRSRKGTFSIDATTLRCLLMHPQVGVDESEVRALAEIGHEQLRGLERASLIFRETLDPNDGLVNAQVPARPR